MADHSEEFGRYVDALLLKHGTGGKRLSLGSASRLTKNRVSHQFIGDWTKGTVPVDADKIRYFADGLREPRIPLLDLAGKRITDEDKANDDKYRFVGHDVNYNADYEEIDLKPNEGKDLLAALKQLGPVFPFENLPIAQGTLPSGQPEYREGETRSDFVYYEGLKRVFGVRAKGDSMVPFYKPNDIVIVRPIIERPKVGGTYVVIIDGDTTCKELEKIEEDEEEIYLTFAPKNSTHERLRVNRDRVIFQGIPIGSISGSELSTAAQAADAL